MAQPPTRRLATEATLSAAIADAAGSIKPLTAASVIDDLTDGIYRVPSAAVAGQIGMPYTAAGGDLTQVTSATITRQAYTPVTPVAQAQTWQRRKVQGVWETWEKVPAGAARVSEDPYAPLSDGQTLYVIDPDIAGTVWATSPFNEGADWTFRWGDDRAEVIHWRSREDGRGEIRQLLGTRRRTLTWDRFNNTVDVDASTMLLMSVTSAAFGNGVGVRVSGDHDGRTGVFAGFVLNQTPDLVVWEFTNGGSRTIARVPFEYAAGDELVVRLAVEGAAVRAKAWKAGSREPRDWAVESTTTVTTPGAVGIYPYAGLALFRSLDVEAL